MTAQGSVRLVREENGSPLTVARGRRAWFVVKAPPQVMLRLKRVFERVNKGKYGEVGLSVTPEASRTLSGSRQWRSISGRTPSSERIRDAFGEI